MFGLAVLFGCGVGFALGLTGGGGGVFAVPLLVYGLAVAPHEAVGISLASVGGIAFAGAMPRLRRGEVEFRIGLLLAVAGMMGAPIGSYLATLLPEKSLLAMFGGLMLVVAWRMWAKTRKPQITANTTTDTNPISQPQFACKRTNDGNLQLTAKCVRLLLMIGLLTGILSGMFGVGGGFVIVPALVLVSGIEIHRAVGTSLLAIFLISISGVASYLINGRELSLDTTLQFLVGGFVGIYLGGRVASKLNGETLQKVFATAVVFVATFVIVKTIVL